MASAAKAPVVVSRRWEGEWGEQALGDERGPHPQSTGRCQKVLDKEREVGRALPAALLGCWDPARLSMIRQETSNKILYLIFSNSAVS